MKTAPSRKGSRRARAHPARKGTHPTAVPQETSPKVWEELRQSEARARELQQQLQAVVDGSAETIIFIKDAQGRFLLANRFLESLMGVPRSGWYMKTDYDLLPRDRAEYYRQHDQEILERGVNIQVEEIVLMPDGQQRDFLANKFPLLDHQGRPWAVCGISVDITERKRMERQLREAQQELARANANLQQAVDERTAELRRAVEELHRFSYTIMHDMRAPLRTMHGYISLIQESCADCHAAQNLDYLRRIQNSATRLDHLIVDSLNYAKISQTENFRLPVHLGTLLKGLVESYPNLLPPHADVRIEQNLPVVLGNEAALTQCFANLLDNAVKFVAPGTKACVRVRADTEPALRQTAGEVQRGAVCQDAAGNPPARLVRVWVEDNGIGIPAENIHRIFGMFERLNTSYQGTGIGLAIVKKAVEQMGGNVGVESEPGKGSRFWIDLPAADTLVANPGP